MNFEKIINWGELSRIITGSRSTIRKNRIPKKHKDFIYELLELINNHFKKL